MKHPAAASSLILLPTLMVSGLSLTLTHAQDFNYRSGLTPPTDVTVPANWSGGIVPAAADFASWITDLDPLMAGNQESTAGALEISSSVAWRGIRFRDSLGAGTLTGAEITLGEGGIQIGYENFRINNVISGSSGIAVTRWFGGGALQFGAANTYTGGTSLAANATLQVYHPDALAGGDLEATGNNATFRVGTGGGGIPANISVGDGLNLNLGGGFNNLSGVISGTGRITSTGTIQLRGSNTYSGGSTMTGGFLCIDRDGNLGAVPAAPVANHLTFTGGGYLSNYIASAPVILEANRGVFLTAGNTGGFDVVGQSLTVRGIISGEGALRKQGAANLILNAANTYTGGTRLAVGTVTVANSSSLGTGDVTVTLSGSNVPVINATAAFSNNIILPTGTALGFGGGFANINGVISGPGRIQTANSGVMRGDNTYEGGTNITGGFLCITKDSSLGLLPAAFAPNNINLGAGGSLSNFPSAAGSAVTVHGNRGITLAAGITGGIDAINATTFVLNGVISGAGGLRTASGATTGTIILNGLNTYNGKTILGRNTTEVSSIKNVGDSGGSSLGNPATAADGTIDLGSGTVANATLRYTGTGDTTDRVINLAATTGGATLEQAGTGLLTFTSPLTATGPGAKTLTFSGSTAGIGEFAGAIVNNQNTAVLAATFTVGSDQVVFTAVDTIVPGASISGTGMEPGTTITAVDPVTRTVTLSGLTNAASSAVNSIYTVTGAFTPTAVAKTGTGTWFLTGENTYTGPTTVIAGTLGGTGSANSALTISSGGMLAPGVGVGSFRAASAIFSAGTSLAAEINSSLGQADRLIVPGAVDLGNSVLMLSDAGSAILPVGTKLTLIDYTSGTLAGTFAGLPEGAAVMAGVNSFTISYADANKVTLTAAASTAVTYATWAAANAGGQAPGLDFDQDGTANGVEYFMGWTGSGFTPGPNPVNGFITWPKDPSAVAGYVVQASDDLTTWTPASGVVDNGTSVIAAIPRRYLRLRVNIP